MSQFRKISTVFAGGFFILFAAVLSNMVATWMGVITWYEFVEIMNKQGFLNTLEEMGLPSIMFLFLVYPFILGFVAYRMSSFFTKTH